ncbi:MAG: VacB/RNase II family 3'-5' exoribonuclease [Deltaproteobacteria bacterium]|nr:VacB/RNase II family 3'-5' exoribonuclease [Deltaproteobacteria bacterium]
MNRLAHAVLELLASEEPPRALHVHEIAGRLGVGDRRALAVALDELVAEGVVRLRSGQRYAVVDRAETRVPREVEGVVHANPKGFAFLRVAGGLEDVFLPADALGGAMHGDRVLARLSVETRRGVEGSVVEVLARGRRRVVGVVRGRPGSFRLEPDDQRVRGPITLADIDPDPSPSAPPLAAGAAAVVELVRYPRFAEELPHGRVVAALGEPGDPDVEVTKILLEHEIDEEQPEAAAAEARSFGDTPDPAELARRVELRHLSLVTIDPKTARDHDDAVWVERDGEGGYRAFIAIADVSHYVTPGSALDASALARGNSVYLPDRSIPMLPHELSSGLCSLLPRQDRLCMCVEVTCDPTGEPRATRIYEAAMRSRAFLTYDSVARALGWSGEAERDPEADAMREDLAVFWELSSQLRKRRMRRGALDLDLPESDIVLDDATRAPTEVTQRAVDPGVRKAYRLIEELMLLANECVARYLGERHVPTIYRVHGPPDPAKLDRFGALAHEQDIAFDPETAEDPRELSRFLRRIEAHPRKATLHMLLLRAMQQAKYDTVNVGHFGLASEAYLHFTSPIRRYSDLVVHRVLRRVLRGEEVTATERLLRDLELAALGASERERLTMESERSIHDLYRALFMRERLGETFTGTVTALTGSGLYVQLPEPFVTVLVLHEDLGPGGYELDESGLRVVAPRSGETIALGDELTLTIVDASITRRTVYGRRVVEEGRGRAKRDGKSRERRSPGAARADRRGGRAQGSTRAGRGASRDGEPRRTHPESSVPTPRGKTKRRLSTSHGRPVKKKGKRR